ncbi:hypothetical protein [Sphingomonas sp.]|uniref:hypothetical protein n=1 Tax=Sphingomonas sp. TaxID=28214 RepID=UPI002DD637BF|nr:hypothetical protein [Sphingomonas sp.]
MAGAIMRRFGLALGVVGSVAIGGFALSQGGEAQPAAGPKARYWIDAETTSGMGAGMNPMAMLTGRGGGNSAQRSLLFRLGSTQAPTGGAPKADHFVPPVLRLGQSVPLETPVPRPQEDARPTDMQRPKGRLRVYWGCGDRVAPGQPVVIDFAKVAAGQFPPNFWTAKVPVEQGPSRANSRTYGHWPNTLDRNRKPLHSAASLIGQHRVAGNYAPEIGFALNQDFMPGVQLRSAAAPAGGVALNWQPVTGATGFYALAIGGMGQGGGDSLDIVWWASSNSREFGGGLTDYLPPATVARLIGQKIVMPPTQTSCTIPAEVKAAAGPVLMTTLTAYGPEANFVHPPRPADPKVPWRPEWTAKVRYKSQAMTLAGMDMGAMMGAAADDDRPAKPRDCTPKKRGLGGLLGKAIGVPTDC